MEITKIEPLNWFVGMHDTTLQLMVYGKGIKDIGFSTNIPNASVSGNIQSDDSIALIILDLSKVELAGEYDLFFKKGQEKIVIKYSLFAKKTFLKKVLSPADVIYLIMPDRFETSMNERCITDIDKSNPYGWHGGTFKGITKHLDYISELGVTSIWLTPVFKNEGPIEKHTSGVYYPYHGYAITDFYDVDKHFGTFDDYLNMVDEAHRSNLKVIKDIVFNHCSIAHPWYESITLNNWCNRSPKKMTNYDTSSIFGSYVSKVYKKQTVEGWFTEQMVDLNLRNEDLLQYLTQVTIWWIEMTNIDAIRMDTYLYSDHAAILKWQCRLNEEYPGLPIIAETWVSESAYTAKIQNESAKMIKNNPLIVMDFAFQKKISEAFKATSKEANDAASKLYNHFLYDFQYYYPHQALAFLDNHDMSRWMFVHPYLDIMKLAIGILLTIPRIPQIYYGTEILLDGAGWFTGDGYMREDFPWDWDNEYHNPIVRKQREEMLKYTKTLLNFRKQSLALTKGDMTHYVPKNNLYVYNRRYKMENILICANIGKEKTTFTLTEYVDGLSKCSFAINVIDGKKFSSSGKIELNKYQILILKIYYGFNKSSC